jgi:hypothetical protein
MTGVAPKDVDTSTSSFLACTPLLDLPSSAAAAYLGTYLLSFLEGMEYQEEHGVFFDLLTRAHTLNCLSDPNFWVRVIRPHLSSECQAALASVARFIRERRDSLALSPEQADYIVSLSIGDE